jgi:hypothetical protein
MARRAGTVGTNHNGLKVQAISKATQLPRPCPYPQLTTLTHLEVHLSQPVAKLDEEGATDVEVELGECLLALRLLVLVAYSCI